MQNSWLSWGLDSMMDKDLTWNKIIYGYNDHLLKFVVNANLLTLPTPDNLRRWNIRDNVICELCTRPNVTLSHILAGCPWVRDVESKLPREDRYTWRHNCVLFHLATAVRQKLACVNSLLILPVPSVPFIRAGEKPPKKTLRVNSFGLLNNSRDWTSDFDLPEFHVDSRFAFPHDVAVTELRCDGYILSRSSKVVIIVELTVPMEENIPLWHSKKSIKYEDLGINSDWKVYKVIIEVGCRGCILHILYLRCRR
jgi:hypothetical protein